MPSEPDRDEPSFVTNVERTVDAPVPLPYAPASERESQSEVGTLPRPVPQLFADDEPIEKTVLLPASDPAPPVHAPMRPRLDSEAAGHWIAPAPLPGVPGPISSDTMAMPRTELVGPPDVGGAPMLPYVPQPTAPFATPPPRRRRSGLLVVGIFLALGATGGAIAALKLGLVRRLRAPVVATVAATTSTPSVTPPAPPSAAPPLSVSPPPAATPAAPEPSTAPASSGKHGHPRRPRRGR